MPRTPWYTELHVLPHLESRIIAAVSHHILIRYSATTAVVLEQPRQTSFGEYALPVAFQLAKDLRKAPRAIAQELADELPPIEGIALLEVAGNGYLNIRLDRAVLAAGVLAGTAPAPAPGGKVLVEHTSINPNKAAHIGHLRNSILGDTFVRMLRAQGRTVAVQNYIDNTGVQVADVVVGFRFLEGRTVEEVCTIIEQPRFDYLCWDLYAKVSQTYATDEALKARRAETLHAIEAGEGELAQMATLVADKIVDYHLDTMLRLGIQYDGLPRESEILHLQFWAAAFEQLKERKAIYLETEGKNKGCWVMPGSAFSDHREDDDSKVIVRSNGTVTYVGKDIAYQMWKFGLLGKDFYYRYLRTYPDGQKLYVTSSTPEGADPNVSFGKCERVYNVIDSRQSYLQDVVQAGLRALGYEQQAKNSIHFSYEMVALTPRTCVELGIQLSEEDRARPYIEVSGRKGLGVKADDLINTLIAAAQREVDSRNAEEPAERRAAVAQMIAIGALRYFMLKFTRPTVIAFDFQEALSFTGETGPYIQYAAVRAAKILAKADPLPDFQAVLTPAVLEKCLADEELWQSLLAAGRTDSALAMAIGSDEPAHMARYAFQLAQAFSNFYQKYPVIIETDPEKRAFLLWLTAEYRAQLVRTLQILGISVPEFM